MKQNPGQAPAGTNTAPQKSRRRWWPLLALTLAVLLAHVWLTYEFSQRMDALAPAPPGIQRMQAAYVSEVKLSAPPVAVAAVQAAAPPLAPPVPQPPKKPKKPKKKAEPAPEAASAPDEAASKPDEPLAAPLLAQAPSDAASAPASPASEPEAPAQQPPAPAATASAALPRKGPTFVWPKATRVSYKLEGNYRGPFYGTAYVEWVRQDNRYQVHMEASVALLGTIRMTSEGLITPQGLSPQRYESVNRMLFRSSKVNAMRFEESEVVLADGNREPRTQEMQDPVSQLIHLAYRFMMNPELLKPGNTIEMPIAWTKKTEVLAYDVIKEEILPTVIGDIPTLHVKPRRVIKDKENLSGEIWFAPGLQYLPVRIFTRWTDEVYLDMRMESAPQQTPGDAPDGPVPADQAESQAMAP